MSRATGAEPREPAVRGILFQPVFAELETELEHGRIRRAALETRLERPELDILDTKLDPARWYPMASFERIASAIDDELARRRRQDWIEQGRLRFVVLSGHGEYQELASRIEDWGGRFGIFGITVWSSFYNFMRWKLEPGERPGLFDVNISGARDLPERERFRLQGFIEAHTSFATSGPAHVSSDRPTPGAVVVRVMAERFRR